ENTPCQGLALGKSLYAKLGANYMKPIHFVSHSLGAMVNARAANYLHRDKTGDEEVAANPWPWQLTHVSLFDEAEIARYVGKDVISNAFVWVVLVRIKYH